MSLILDALRKSEAERRKAHSAGEVLAAEVPRVAARRWAGMPAWVWPFAALAALVMVLLAWWLGGRIPIDSANPAPPVLGQAPAAVHGGITTPPVASPARDASPGAPPLDHGTTIAVQAGITSPAASVAPREAVAIPPPGNAPANAAVPSAPTPYTASATRSEALPSIAPPHPPPSANAPPLPSMRDTRAPPAPSTTRAGPADGLLRLADLGNADRQQLPPLKMSMHLWGPDAATRFAIIDGNRVGEGDRVGEAVVEAIDQDGVVLAWNGYRLRLPVR